MKHDMVAITETAAQLKFHQDQAQIHRAEASRYESELTRLVTGVEKKAKAKTQAKTSATKLSNGHSANGAAPSVSASSKTKKPGTKKPGTNSRGRNLTDPIIYRETQSQILDAMRVLATPTITSIMKHSRSTGLNMSFYTVQDALTKMKRDGIVKSDAVVMNGRSIDIWRPTKSR